MAIVIIRHILLSDILALQRCFKTMTIKRENVVENEVRGEAKVGGSKTKSLFIVTHYNPIHGTITAESGVHIPSEAVKRLPSTL